MFFYDTEARGGFAGNFRPEKYDASEKYLEHYQNFLTLDFFYRNGNQIERNQAKKEIEIAHRKMKYWARQENYNEKLVMKAREELNKKMKIAA